MFNSLCTFLYLRLLCSLCGHWILTSKVFLVRRTGLKDVPLSRHDDIQHTGPSRPHSRLFVQKYVKNLQGSMLPKLEWPDWRAWNLLVQPWQLLLFCWELSEAAISDALGVVGSRLYQAVSVKKGHAALGLLEGKSS